MQSTIRGAGLFGFCLKGLILLACASTSYADIEVVKLRLAGKSKVSDTELEYSYKVDARNNGGAASGVTAQVRSYSSIVTVVSAGLDFPDMAAGETATSDNRLVIRKGKKARLPRHLLRFDFSAIAMPVARTGPDQLGAVGAGSVLNARRSYDPFGRPLTYAWSLDSAPGGSAATLDDASSLAPRFVPDIAGDYAFRLTVSNGVHTSAPSLTTISTIAARPLADAGRRQTVKRRSVVQLDGSASTNPMERPLTYAWQILSTPEKSKAVLSDPSALRPTFRPDRKGDYRVQLIVTDGALSSAPSVVTITRGKKKTNTRPYADAGPDISSFGVSLPVILQAGLSVDEDGDFLTYRWSVLSSPAGSLAGPTFHDPNPIFRPDAAGLWHLQVNVSDGKSESIATVLLDTDREAVAPVPGAAVAWDAADPTLFQLSANPYSAYVVPTRGDDGGMTSSWSVLSRPPGSSAIPTSPSSTATSFPTDVDGDYVVQLKVGDNGSTDSLQSIGITRGPSRPVAVVDPLHFVDWGPDLPVTLDGSRSQDPTGLPLTYRWTVVHRPAGSNPTLINPSFPSATLLLDVDGTYVVQLVVSNGAAQSLPVSKSLVHYVNKRPVGYSSDVVGPKDSPCITVALFADDEESNHAIVPGMASRRVFSTVEGVLIDFVDIDTDGVTYLCYRPRFGFTGSDLFLWEAVDSGFPWGCKPTGPGCYGLTTSAPVISTIFVIEVGFPGP